MVSGRHSHLRLPVLQEPGGVGMLVVGSPGERCIAVVISHVDVSPRVQEHFQHGHVSIRCGHNQRRATQNILAVDVRARLQ